MRLGGTRADGAVYLLYGGGLAVILKGDRISPTVDDSVVEAYGPWVTPTEHRLDERRRLQAKADLAKVVPVERFALADAEPDAEPSDDNDPLDAAGEAHEAVGHGLLEKTLSPHDRPIYDGLKPTQQRGVRRAVADHATTHGDPHTVGITFNPQGHGRAHVDVTSTPSGLHRYVVGAGGAVTKG